MIAKIEPSYDPNRQRLVNLAPLNTPFTVYIEPTRFCNFKCFYCMHSTRGEPQGEFAKTGYDLKNISPELYENLLIQLQEFPSKIKRIVFSGLGEPLMNPALPEMINKARLLDVSGRIDIITNGALLTPKISDALVSAGVSRIQISLQGLAEDDYRQNCGVSIDLERFVSNLRYLFANKGKTQVYIKIIDVMLKNENDENKFYDIFGSMCDSIFIEHLISLEQQMGGLDGKANNNFNLYNQKNEVRFVCSVPFYHLDINADGDVFACPAPGLPIGFAYGNAKNERLVDIWKGKKRNNFLKAQITVGWKNISWCKTCANNGCILGPEENLDHDTDRILTVLANEV